VFSTIVGDITFGRLGERAAPRVLTADHDAAVQRYELLLGTAPTREFTIPGRDLTVTIFPGISIISGTPNALAPIQALRATVFVDSVLDTEAREHSRQLADTNPATDAIARLAALVR
jgi:hypothetical protein